MNFGYLPSNKRIEDVITKLFGWMHVLRRIQVPVFITMLDLDEEDLFLDLGCGGGNFAYEMSRRCKCVGIDISPNIGRLASAQKRLTNLNFVGADGLGLPFKDHSFDRVLLGGTLQSVRQDNELLRECRRVLKKDGVLVLSAVQGRILVRQIYDSNKAFAKIVVRVFGLPQSYTDFENDYIGHVKMTKFYTVEDLTRLLEANGFEIEEIDSAPKELGSKMLDFLLLLFNRLRIPPPNHPIWFPVLYASMRFIDRFNGSDGKRSKGNEILIKAKVQ